MFNSTSPAVPAAAAAAVAVAVAAVAPPSDVDVPLSELAGLELYAESDEEEKPPPRRLLRAECILAKRSARFTLVIETIQDDNNYQAILRTAESFGVQNVWVVESGIRRKHEEKRPDEAAGSSLHQYGELGAASASSPSASLAVTAQHDTTGKVSMAAGRWLSLRYFSSTADCIEALRADGREIWVTSLAQGCVSFDRGVLPLPKKLAIVLGRELDGVSAEMCAAASKAVFLPMIGFSESFNVSVAGALVLQRLFDLAPEAIGDMSADERSAVRRQWYKNLSLATPGAEVDYMEFWLPRHEKIISCMKDVVAREGELFLLRPTDAHRLPKVSPKVRRRMEQKGQRSVVVPSTKASGQ